MADVHADELAFLEGTQRGVTTQMTTLNEAADRTIARLRARLQESEGDREACDVAFRAAELEIKRVNMVSALQVVGDVMEAYLTSAGAGPEAVESLKQDVLRGMVEVNDAFLAHPDA